MQQNSIERRARILAELKEEGLTIGECITAFAVSNEDPYVRKARELIIGGDDHEIDDKTTTSVGDDGAWVLSWLWVSSEEAGVLPYADLLEHVLDKARAYLQDEGQEDSNPLSLDIYADWLEALLVNFSDEIDGIEEEQLKPGAIPGAITWVDEAGGTHRFLPSDAIGKLVATARQGCLSTELTNQADEFCRQFGNKVDAILTDIQIA